MDAPTAAGPGHDDCLFALPPMGANDESRRLVEEYVRKDEPLSHWVQRPTDVEGFAEVFAELPMEDQLILASQRDAFPFWRASLLEYSERIRGISPWTETIRSVLERLRQVSKQDVEGFEQVAWDERERLQVQRDNAVDRYQALTRERTKDVLRGLLSAYSDIYELDYTLWFLGVLGKAYKTGVIDTSAFGGPQSATAQGALVEQVSVALAGTPFEPLFDTCYDRELRNAIGHNDYELRPDNDDHVVVRLSDGKQWHPAHVEDLLRNTFTLVTAVSQALPYDRQALAAARSGVLNDCGVVDWEGLVSHMGVALIAMAQLWCFRDLDPRGKWLDSASFSLEPLSDTHETLRFSEHTVLTVPRLSTTPLGAALRDRGWVLVVRIPVAPSFELGMPTFATARGLRYELVGAPDEHVVPISVQT